MTGTVLTRRRSVIETPRNALAPLVVVVGSGAAREEAIETLEDEHVEISFADGLDTLAGTCLERQPSVVVVIAEASPSSWTSRLAGVREHAPQARLVLLCDSIEGWEVRAALAAGAAGIVLAAELSTALGPCLMAVRTGQICVPQANRRVIERPVLSAREKQILGLVVMGYMNGQIAEQLFLAESTVKSHLSSVFAKLGVRSRHEAVDLILDREGGLDLGILALGGEPLDARQGAKR